VEWLGSDFWKKRVLTTAKNRSDGEQPQIKANESLMLTRLVNFVDSPEFQGVAAQDAHKLWDGITADAVDMNKLGIFSSDVMGDPEVFRKVIAQSTSFLNMPTIHFENKRYNDFVKNFRPWRYKEVELIDQLGRQLDELFSSAAKNPEKPENCLFMAFVMGMHDFWDSAVEMAERGSEHLTDKRSEFDYFLAYAKYRKVDMHGYPPAIAREHFIDADSDIRAALKVNPYDPRYLERRGAIALRYHYNSSLIPKDSLKRLPKADIANITEARGFLKQAVSRGGHDPKIRVRALNNLAYSFGTSDPPELKEAAKCITQIEKEFDTATSDGANELPDLEQWPFVMDTIWYIGAKIAHSEGNADELRRNRERLQTAVDRANLLEAEAKNIEEHILEIQSWENELATVS
jgi:hypothetical protein